MAFTLRYSGGIDDHVCYTDVADSVFQTFNNATLLHRTERVHACLSRNYTLLTPECLWYPVSNPPNVPGSPWMAKRAFTHYQLRVTSPDGQTVISQGERREQEGYVEFIHRHPLPGISLTVGKYEHKSIVADSITYEWYYTRKNNRLLDYFSLMEPLLPRAIREVHGHQMTMRGKIYPFSRFIIVEVPYSFCSYGRWWKNHTEFIQPEILFFPENGTKLGVDLRNTERTAHQTPGAGTGNQVESDTLFRKRVFVSYLSTIFNRQSSTGWLSMEAASPNDFNMQAQFHDFCHFIESEECPIIDKVFSTIRQSWFMEAPRHPFFSTDHTLASLSYLAHHSLKEAVEDHSLSDELLFRILRLKSDELKNYILSIVETRRFDQFLSQWENRYSFGTLDFGLFGELFLKAFDVDLMEFIDRWYTHSGMAEMIIHKSTAQEVFDDVDGQVKYQVKLIISNTSDTHGVVSCYVSYGRQNFFYIPGNSTREISFLASRKPEVLNLNTNISANYPPEHTIPLYVTAGRGEPIWEGIREAAFSESAPTGEIILDNEDSTCFRTSSSRRLFLGVDRSAYQKLNLRGLLPGDWVSVADRNCYGGVIRSAVYKKRGMGKATATWSYAIETAGEYEIYAWNVNLKSQYNRPRQQTYQVRHGDNSTEVTLELTEEPTGWVSMGYFHLPAGEVTIELSDRTSSDFVIADAVKLQLMDKGLRR